MRSRIARWLIIAARYIARQVAEAALEDVKRRVEEGGDRR